MLFRSHIQADNDCYVLNCMLFNLKIENNLFDEPHANNKLFMYPRSKCEICKKT